MHINRVSPTRNALPRTFQELQKTTQDEAQAGERVVLVGLTGLATFGVAGLAAAICAHNSYVGGAVAFGSVMLAGLGGLGWAACSKERPAGLRAAADATWTTREETFQLGNLSRRTVVATPEPPAAPPPGGVAAWPATPVEILDEVRLPDGTVVWEQPSTLLGDPRTLHVDGNEAVGSLEPTDGGVTLQTLSADGKFSLAQELRQDGVVITSTRGPGMRARIVHHPDGKLSCSQGEVTFADGVYQLAPTSSSGGLSVRPLIDPRRIYQSIS